MFNKNTVTSYNLILPKYLRIVKEKGSRMSKTRIWVGWDKRFHLFIIFFSYFGPAVCSLKKFQGEAQAGGQKEKVDWGK